MLGSKVVLFPDYGDGFVRSLKTNALYAKEVTSPLAVLTSDEEQKFREVLKHANELDLPSSEPIRRLLLYVESLLAAQSVVRPLVKASILSAPSFDALRASIVAIAERAATQKSTSTALDTPLRGFWAADAGLIDVVRRAHRAMPPSLIDAMPLFLIGDSGEFVPPDPKEISKYPIQSAVFTLAQRSGEFDSMALPLFGFGLAILAAEFEALGTPIVWTEPLLRDALWAIHRIIVAGQTERLSIDAESLLGTTILETYLPVVDDLPIDEILTFRSKHEAELEGFRSGVSELSTSIDLTKPVREIERQAQDLVRSKVNPAIRDLKAKLKISRLDALQKIGKSWKSMAGLTFSATIAALAGAPIDLVGVAGLIGSLGLTLVDRKIEKRKILHASQWAAVLRLSELREEH